MTDSKKIATALDDSPSVALLKMRNRKTVVLFLIDTFPNQQGAITEESIQNRLADFLEARRHDRDEDGEDEGGTSYETRAKDYLLNWTNRGFLTNYQDQRGEVFYELSAHSSKTIDWLASLKKEEYVGTESKFKNIFSQLKTLVEFTNEDTETRLELLETKKREIEVQIERIRAGEDIEVFEEFEIVPRFNQLNQSAKELLSDFKEVEENFKEITKNVFQKHAEGGRSKSDILDFTFGALDELKESPQGKSFYAFWSFLLNPELQLEWERLTGELYQTLEDKDISASDSFLKRMKNHLHASGQKVYKANDRMAEKLSRIIRENDLAKTEVTRNAIQEIKKLLIEVSKTGQQPKIGFELEKDISLFLPFERTLTWERRKEITYTAQPIPAEADITQSAHLGKLFSQATVDKKVLRKRIREVLKNKSQTTLHEVIEVNGGIEQGLAELFGYLGILKDFQHDINPEKQYPVIFDVERNKSIQVPEIILKK